MVTISVLEFRRDAKGVIRRLRQGQRMILSYRGKPVARMEPFVEKPVGADDPIYSLADLAVSKLASYSNEAMDGVIYEK
jgi:antitoxin (DNA-binding transcriptional repressor) of toxin-antitoxin stability system